MNPFSAMESVGGGAFFCFFFLGGGGGDSEFRASGA